MNSMVLISKEVRSDLLGRRLSSDREARIPSFETRVSVASDLVDGIGEVRVSPVSDTVSPREMDCDSPEGSDGSDDWRTWMHGFEIGDMVWGKVKSHPWWPGHIFNEAFASSLVRRTRREGHVLVAFFGDSSYGWFEPAELVPFDSHFAEKSKQSVSKNFLKAVEEAVDEVSRRRALGLSCRCRDPLSFRATSVAGYVAVDVIGYEPNLVYSMKEVRKARDAFMPADLVSGLGQLALAPTEVEGGNIELSKMLATLLALRKARFEEFDETYAQAFGVEPVRPSRDARGVAEPLPSVPMRAAPLSGPLVVAEALGKKRSGGVFPKSVVKASKDHIKKNKYLFKRRDDVPPHKHQSAEGSVRYVEFPHGRSGPDDASPQSRAASTAPDGFVLQKRESEAKPEAIAKEVDGSGFEFPPDEGPIAGDVEEKPDRTKVEAVTTDGEGEGEGKPVVELDDKKGGGAPTFGEESGKGDEGSLSKPHDASVSGVAVQKVKKPMDVAVGGDKKMKKRKMSDAEGTVGVEQRILKQARANDDAEVRRRPAAKVGGVVQAAPVVSQAGQHVDKAAGSFSAISLPKIELRTQDLDFPLLLSDLSNLALDPYYGMERNASLMVRHVFLRFRSLVYQKSLVPLPVNESDADVRARPEIAVRSTGMAPSQTVVRDQQAAGSLPKLAKKIHKAKPGSDNMAKFDRKRPSSDRQEERTINREKKLKVLKSLASEKKAGLVQKVPADAQKPDGLKDDDAKAGQLKKTGVADKKQEPPAPPKVPSPTYLVMKFPPGTTLPSISSQKVKFGRFGPLDVSGFRVYWKSHTCKMLFKFRADAQNAFMYAVNNDMFGQIKVNYSIREFEVPAPEPVEAGKQQPAEPRVDDVQSKIVRNNESMNEQRLPALRNQQQQSIQLKSCLKKPSGDEQPGNLAVVAGRENARVKFALEGEGRLELPAASGNGGNGNAIPPSVPQPIPQRPLNPPPPPSPHPLPRPFEMHARLQFVSSNERGVLPLARAQPPFRGQQPQEANEISKADIGGKLISLLIRCHDVVNSLNSTLGYVIYQPL